MGSGRGSAYGFFFIFVVGTIVSFVWQLPHWFATGGHPNRRTSAKVVAEARDELENREVIIRTLRVSGTLKREMWIAATKQWEYAGDNASSCVYEYGPAGRARVECTREVELPLESDLRVQGAGGDYPMRQFTAMFDGKAGETVITGQGGLKSGKNGRVVVQLESGRPASMQGGDESSGWRYAVYGRWIGGGENGEGGDTIFSEMIDGKEPGATVTGKDVEIDLTPLLQIMVTRADRTDIYWLDINQGYSIVRWEERENAAAGAKGKESSGRLLRDAHITDFWVLPRDIYYPRHIEAKRYAADGTAVQREIIEVTEVTLEDKLGGDELVAIGVPAGEVAVQQGDKEQKFDGTVESNEKAVAEMLQAMEK